MFHFCNVPMFQCCKQVFKCYNVPMLQCSNVATFQCSNVAILPSSNVEMLQPSNLPSCNHEGHQGGPAAEGEALRIRPISQRLTQAVLKTCQNPPESGSDKTPYPSQHPPALCRRERLSRPLASIFRPFFQTLILTLSLSSRGVPLEALGATLAFKGPPEAPKCLPKVTQIWLQTGFGEMLFLITPPMKIAHLGGPGGSEMEPKRRPRKNAAQRCSKMLPEAPRRGPRWSQGRM